MIKYFLLTFVRNFKRHSGYSLVNILGLSIGIATTWIIFQYISFENSYDSFHPKADHVYKIYPTMEFSNSPTFFVNTPIPIGKGLKELYPEVQEQVTTISYLNAKVWPSKSPEFSQYNEDFLFVDQHFFEVFSFPLIRGTSEALFDGPNHMFISEQMATTYFASENPLGQEMAVHVYDSTHYFVVKGVLKDFPDNTKFTGHFLLSHTGYESLQGPSSLESWGRFAAETFLIFEDTRIAESFEDKIGEYYASQRKEEALDSKFTFSLKQLTQIHLDENIGQVKRSRLLTFALIGWAILLVACINYMNLATARASLRDREIGVKKVLGANRKQLITQFLGEAIVFGLIATILAIALIDLSIPHIANFVQKRFAEKILTQPNNWIVILGLGAGVGILSGIYPAWMLAGKGNLSKHFILKKEKGYLRKALVGVQFLVAAIMITSVLIIQKQLYFMQHEDLGFDKEQVVYIELPRSVKSKHKVLKSSFLAIPEVLAASSCNFTLDGKYGATSITPPNAKEESFVMMTMADESFSETLKLPLVEGRWPKPSKLGAIEVEVLINEAFQKEFGLEQPIGLPFSEEQPESKIVGVVKDFHPGSLKYGIKPILIFGLTDQNVRHIALKIQGGNIPETLEKLEAEWRGAIVGEPFSYSFLEDRIDKLYEEERTFARLIEVFSGLAIFIGCIGLLALVAFTSEAKSKEIGIRKVLGASIGHILTLLNRSYFMLIGASFLLAIPLTVWLMQRWLDEFAYRINLHPASFLWAGAILMGFTLLTVSYYSLKAALADPVLALKDE